MSYRNKKPFINKILAVLALSHSGCAGTSGAMGIKNVGLDVSDAAVTLKVCMPECKTTANAIPSAVRSIKNPPQSPAVSESLQASRIIFKPAL